MGGFHKFSHLKMNNKKYKDESEEKVVSQLVIHEILLKFESFSNVIFPCNMQIFK